MPATCASSSWTWPTTNRPGRSGRSGRSGRFGQVGQVTQVGGNPTHVADLTCLTHLTHPVYASAFRPRGPDDALILLGDRANSLEHELLDALSAIRLGRVEVSLRIGR